MADNNGTGMGSVLLSFVAGAAIGGAVALLTAPKSGPETREMLRDLADETRDKLNAMTKDAELRIKEMANEGREAIRKQTEKS